MQLRSQEARQNWESALSSKDRALSQLEDALVTQKRTLQQQVEQQHAAVSMTHNQLVETADTRVYIERQLIQSQQQAINSAAAASHSLCYARPGKQCCAAEPYAKHDPADTRGIIPSRSLLLCDCS